LSGCTSGGLRKVIYKLIGFLQVVAHDALEGLPCGAAGEFVHQDDQILEADESAKPNRNWARLIQKRYEVDPLTCPQCQGPMRIIGIIEDQEVVDKILRHLGLWQTNRRPPPKPKPLELPLNYSDSQLPGYEDAVGLDFGVSASPSAS